MGLSGRKIKQRIGKDPRNLSWADDASRFGQSYLEKFGWDASKGLGASGEGRTSAVKMSQKLDMLGIGMQRHQNDPDSIAWRQNRDFENLLQRLNEGTETTVSFHEARGSLSSSSIVEEEVAVEVDGSHDADEGAGTDTIKRARKKKKQKKRKELQEEEGDEKAVRDKRERKKRKRSMSDVPVDHASGAQAAASESTPAPTASIAAPTPVRALPRAHRARMIAAKRMAVSNSTALAEILGIPSSSTTVSPSPLTAATVATTPIPTPATTEDDDDPLQKLTTATQSVGDYLRAKLGAKAGARQNSIALAQDADRDDDDTPRAGLGATARSVLTGPSDEPVRAASILAAMFARGQATAGAKEGADGASVERDDGDIGDEEEWRKRERRRTKAERRKKKEDRRRRKEEEGKIRAIAEPDAEPPGGAQVMEPSMGEAPPRRTKRKKHRELDIPDDLLEHSLVTGDGRTDVPNKKQKERDKSRKTRRDANP